MLNKLSRVFSGAVVLTIVISLLAISACKEEETEGGGEKPAPSGFTITNLTSGGGGSLIITPQGPYARNTIITLELAYSAAAYVFDKFEMDPPITPTPQPDGKYQFPMPNRNVTIEALFLSVNDYPFPITKGTHVNGDFEISPSGNQKSGTLIGLTPLPTDDAYKFDRWTTTPASLANSITSDPLVSGRYTFTMLPRAVTINAVFVIDTVPPITSGTIVVEAPVAGGAAPALQSNAGVTAGAFTGKLNAITGTGLIPPGTQTSPVSGFSRKSLYIYEFILTPNEGTRFGMSTNITVRNGVGTVFGDTEYLFKPGQATATLRVKFPRTIDRPGDPTAVDLALGMGGEGKSVTATNSAYNNSSSVSRPFEGTSWLISSSYFVWQADGQAQPHWVSIDLGSVKTISTVVVTWGPGSLALSNGTLAIWDGMVAGEIQVSNGDPYDPSSGEEPPVEKWNHGGVFNDIGWTKVAGFRNIARGEKTPGVLETDFSAGPDTVQYIRNRQDNPKANFIRINPPATGRYIRLKASAPYTSTNNNDSLNNGNAQAWTQWPRVSAFEVYAEALTTIETGEAENPPL